MFETHMLPSSFQTPTSSLASSDKLNHFQQDSSLKASPYNISTENPTIHQNVTSSQNAFVKLGAEPLLYSNLPPLQPISFKPPSYNSPPLIVPKFTAHRPDDDPNNQNSTKIDQLRNDNFNLYFENRKIKQQSQKLHADNEAIVKQYNKIHKELDVYKKDADRSKILQSLNANLKTQINLVLDELRNQKNKIQALEREIDILRKQIQNHKIGRENEKLAYKNLLSELHTVKEQLENIRKGPSQLFRNNAHLQSKINFLEQQKFRKQHILSQLKMQLQQTKQQTISNKQPSKGQQMIMDLQKQIKQAKVQMKSVRDSNLSKKVTEDKHIRNLKQLHQEQIGRLKRQIGKKECQAQQLEDQLSKLQY